MPDEELELLKRRRRRKKRFMTGEDIDMFHEREQENRNKKEEPICDRHIDGA